MFQTIMSHVGGTYCELFTLSNVEGKKIMQQRNTLDFFAPVCLVGDPEKVP